MAYLVPFDFTPEAEAAVDHALCLHEVAPGPIVLLHMVKAPQAAREFEHRLEVFIASLSPDKREKLSYKVVRGSIFHDIGKISDFMNARMVIMGSHNVSILRRLVKGNAITVMKNSIVPFIVNQKKGPKAEGYKKIVLATDMIKDFEAILSLVAELSTLFEAHVYCICEAQNDETQNDLMTANIRKSIQLLHSKNINADLKLAEGIQAFATEVMDLASEIDADLIAVGFVEDSLIPQFDSFVQKILVNKNQIPVLAINSSSFKDMEVGQFLT